MMEASPMANDPPSIWNGIQNLQSTISSALPAVWKLSPNANATYCCIFTPKKYSLGISAQKSWVPRGRTLTGNKAHIACTFPLDPMASYEPVWGIWDEHDSDLEWAGAALFMCAQNKVSWAGLAAQPQGSDARKYIVRTQGPKHTHLTHMRLVLCSYAETLLMQLCLCLIIPHFHWKFQCDFAGGRCPSEILLLANCFGGRGNKVLNNLKLIWNHGCSWPMEHRQELQDGCDHKCSCGDLGDSNTPDLKHQHNHSWFKSTYTLCLTLTNCGGIFTMPCS